MQRFNRLWLAGIVVAALFVMLPALASAHERREVADGKYTFVVGFLDEPAFTTVKNGLSLRVTTAPEGTPAAEGEEVEAVGVEGLEATLNAEVIYADQKRDLTLEPAFRDPGAYESWFFPMAAGDYSFHIFGEIEGTAIDETFTSGPETFSAVEDRALYEFPNAAGSTTDVAAIGNVASGNGNSGNGTLIGGIVLAAIAGAAGLAVVQRSVAGRRTAARQAAAHAKSSL